jgi:hypothetical protein
VPKPSGSCAARMSGRRGACGHTPTQPRRPETSGTGWTARRRRCASMAGSARASRSPRGPAVQGTARATATRVAQHRLVGTITGGDDGARSTLCVEEAARESWGALRAHGYPAPRRQGARPGGKVPAAQRWRALALLAAPSGSAGWLRAAQRRSTPGRLWGARARVQPFVPLCAVGAWGMQVWGFVSYGKR